jgi:hypothetical protein
VRKAAETLGLVVGGTRWAIMHCTIHHHGSVKKRAFAISVQKMGSLSLVLFIRN